MRPRPAAAVLIITALAAACGDAGTPSPTLRVTALGGNRQVDSAGRPLPTSFRVAVEDLHGAPQEGVLVRWQVVRGGGTLVPATSRTDAQGVAAATLTLGLVPGEQTVEARVDGAAGSPVVFTAYAFGDSVLVASVPIPPFYGIHDTFVRDGLAFVCAWDSGVIIFDVGNGIRSGSPYLPTRVSTIVTANGNAHNAWWFHNGVTGEQRYLFVGEEGPGVPGGGTSGDIHVVDVSNIAQPAEVAFYHQDGAGTHNFWMDEGRGILYAAYYNGGVVALDVSGTLSGNLASRELSRIRPGGDSGTFVWGVQLAGSSLYAIDMLSGLWQLHPGPPLTVAAGGFNVANRYSSDLWVRGAYAYTGTYRVLEAGNVVNIWSLNASGAPALVDSIVRDDIGTVSDVEVSSDGRLLMFSAEGGAGRGLYWYSLDDPRQPLLLRRFLVPSGVHTATFAVIGGKLFAFAARNPPDPALLIFDVTSLVQ